MDATKTRLLLAAEQLIGDRGVHNVSMRQISELSGNRNVAAAQYHFGSLDRLIHALIAYRKATLDHLRERFYRELDMDFSHMTVRDYVSLVVHPHLNIRDEGGTRRFARFLKAVQRDPDYYRIWLEHYRDAPFAKALYFGLRRELADLPEPIWMMRMKAMGKFIVTYIVDYDLDPPEGRPAEDQFASELIALVTSCLTCENTAHNKTR